MLDPPSWILKIFNSDLKFVICDLKNFQKLIFMKIKIIFELLVRHVGSAILNFAILTSDS
jgi:hypothetical protein